MLEWIEFKNFKALRDTRLPLGRFTLIVGANGCGKSTALKGIMALALGRAIDIESLRTVGTSRNELVTLTAHWSQSNVGFPFKFVWNPDGPFFRGGPPPLQKGIQNAINSARCFSLDAESIAQPVALRPDMELQSNGAQLAGVLDRIRDQHPEQFEAINEELMRWIPEFDRILFETPHQGHRSLALRTREGKHTIKAADLSQGTLIALALLTIAYLPTPPSIVCLEEPDHGLHPRLLREVRDALYRLAFPEDSGEKREPVQVIATTHNPYFLDLFREHPEQIVIAEKVGLEGKFTRLSDRKDLEEILGDAPLSEVWYSGVLGGGAAGT
jgi:predicted ATPase